MAGLTVVLVCKDTRCPSFGRRVQYPLGRDRLCDGCGGRLNGWLRGDWQPPVASPDAAAYAAREASVAAATAQPAGAGPQLRSDGVCVMSPADFQAAILAAVGSATAIDVRKVFAAILRTHDATSLVVNGRPAKVQEVRQMAARMARDGKLLVHGDTLGGAR